MALISCPDCHNELSDHAHTCPHCGYPMTYQEDTRFQSTPIGEPERNIATGILCVVSGLFFLPFAFLYLFSLIGIGMIVLCFYAFRVAYRSFVGTCVCTCPHCQREGTLSKYALDYQCKACKTISLVQDGCLVLPQ